MSGSTRMEPSPTSTASTPTALPATPSNPDSLAITIFTISGILVLSSLAGFFLYRRKKAKGLLSHQELRHFFNGSPSTLVGALNHPMEAHEFLQDLPYDRKLEINQHTFEIHEGRILGSGSFGIVVKGCVWNEDVAVKTTRPEVEKVYLKALLSELKVLMYLGQHANIVNLKGAHTSQLNTGKLYIFLELCPFGNLLEYLRNHRDHFSDARSPEDFPSQGEGRQLTCKDLLQWSIQIASAMGHLEYKKVVHGDIAARNILVFSRDQVKLTDFGLSRRLYEYSACVKRKEEPLPWRHMSLEALQDRSFSVQSDVWSFGVTLWEIFSLGEVPYPGLSWTKDFLKLLADGARLLRPPHAHPLIYEVMTSCWTQDIKSRPSAAVIKSQLTAVLDKLYSNSYLRLADIP